MAHNYDHFVVIVAGEDYNELLEKYDKNKYNEYRVIYKYEDAERIKDYYIRFQEEIIKDDSISLESKENALNDLKMVKEMDNDDFYFDFTSDFDYDENYNAISNENPNGKYSYYSIGKHFSIPFILKDNTTSFSAKKNEINWNKMFNYDRELYETTWDLVMNGKTPETEQEKTIYNNMKHRVNYFKDFGDKDTYVNSNTAFWSYAFLSEETGWVDMENYEQFVWINNYYNTFIKNLPENIKLHIIECKK